MPDWSGIIGSNLYETIGADVANTRGTTVASGLANVKGAWVQLVASTAFYATGIAVYHFVDGSSPASRLLDIGVGAAASEQAIIENILLFGRAQDSLMRYFPISIPAGSRITARLQLDVDSQNSFIHALLFSQPFLPHAVLGRCTTYGANTGDSGGVGVDPGAVVDTKGAYSQIIASTTRNIRFLVPSIGNQSNSAMSTAEFFMDIAVGAGGSEQNILENYFFRFAAQEFVSPGGFPISPVNIPAGSRLAARAQCSINDATDRLFDVTIHGVD